MQEIKIPLAFWHFPHTLKSEAQEFGVLCKQSQTYSTNQIHKMGLRRWGKYILLHQPSLIYFSKLLIVYFENRRNL